MRNFSAIARRNGLSIGPPSVTALAPTGEPHQELSVEAPTEQEAWDALRAAFLAHIEGKRGAVYWRRKPEVTEKDGRWRGYARLTVSDKPMLDVHVETEAAAQGVPQAKYRAATRSAA